MSTLDAALLILAALIAGVAFGWFASLRWARPPQPPALSPADVDALKRAFKGLFAQFIDNTTAVVGGLQEDVGGLMEAIDRISKWTPGNVPESPAQLARWMAESSDDRKQIHRRLDRQAWLLYAVAPMVVVIFARIVYVVLWGAS